MLVNPLGVDEAALEADVLPPLVASLLPSVAGSLASFPLPEFFGLSLSGVEISRNGQFMTLYANLVADAVAERRAVGALHRAGRLPQRRSRSVEVSSSGTQS